MDKESTLQLLKLASKYSPAERIAMRLRLDNVSEELYAEWTKQQGVDPMTNNVRGYLRDYWRQPKQPRELVRLAKSLGL